MPAKWKSTPHLRFAQFMEFEKWKIGEGKNREESLKIAEKVGCYLQKMEEKRWKIMFLIFIVLLGCLMGSVFFMRNLRDPIEQKRGVMI